MCKKCNCVNKVKLNHLKIQVVIVWVTHTISSSLEIIFLFLDWWPTNIKLFILNVVCISYKLIENDQH